MPIREDISMHFLTHVGDNIRRVRKDNSLSMEELGLEIGLTRMQVHRIEQGYNITLITLLKVSMALKVKPEDLVRHPYRWKKEELEKLVNNNKSSRSKKK